MNYGEAVNFPAVTFCNLNSVMKSRLGLGGEAIEAVIRDAEDALEKAATGSSERKKRKRKRSAENQGENVKKKQAQNAPLDKEDGNQQTATGGHETSSEKRSVKSPRGSITTRSDGSKVSTRTKRNTHDTPCKFHKRTTSTQVLYSILLHVKIYIDIRYKIYCSSARTFLS